MEKYFTIWVKNSVNIHKIAQNDREKIRQVLPQRRTSWLTYSNGEDIGQHLAQKMNFLWKCRKVFIIWKRRLFQKREIALRFKRKDDALVQTILQHCHGQYQQRRFSTYLSLWSLHHAEQLKRSMMRRWHFETMKRKQAFLYWQRGTMLSCFQVWKKRMIESSMVNQRVLAFQMTWRLTKIRTIFGLWRAYSLTQRKAAIFQRAVEHRTLKGLMEHWAQSVQEAKAERYLRNRRKLWALTRWKTVLDLQSQLSTRRNIVAHCTMGNFWQIWLFQHRLVVECQKYRNKVLCKRVFNKWALSAQIHTTQREAATQFMSDCCHRLLLSYFHHWKNKFLKKQLLVNVLHQKKKSSKDLQRWKAATRGHQALILHSTCSVKQASNFWTRAAAVSRYRTKAHAPIGGRKLRKTCLLLATAPKKRNGGFIRQTGNNERLVQSSFRYWLFLYRNHAVREEIGCPGDCEAEGLSGSSTNVLSPSEELLRNPLHEANLLKLLDGFQRSQERVRLGIAWLYWRGIYNTVIMGKGMNIIREEITAVRNDLTALEQRVDDLEAERLQDTQHQQATDLATTRQGNILLDLRHQIEDLDNRGRRNNIRIQGLPEAKGEVPQEILAGLFTELLGDAAPSDFGIERAHRALRAPRRDGLRRDRICALVSFQLKESLMLATRTQQHITYMDAQVSLFQDLSTITLDARRALRPLTCLLQERSIPYKWGFPFSLQRALRREQQAQQRWHTTYNRNPDHNNAEEAQKSNHRHAAPVHDPIRYTRPIRRSTQRNPSSTGKEHTMIRTHRPDDTELGTIPGTGSTSHPKSQADPSPQHNSLTSLHLLTPPQPKPCRCGGAASTAPKRGFVPAQLTYWSNNVQGLNTPEKRSHLLRRLWAAKAYVAFLQETHLRGGDAPKLENRRFPQGFYANHPEAKKAAILFAQATPFHHTAFQEDPNGRYLFLKGTIAHHTYTFACLYGPNRKQHLFIPDAGQVREI
ncbi:Hypothetical predicted protein [Pelobates cultripes]|uniref:Uncharacterized protein n=1 Tax=Pelobates cultripes TaxID=61616 RepID=A0AAD1T890_PELCU|nr:Hypothetical predicted protein [Pelobates cultripes]